jgi:hypothetical protein
MSSRRQGEKGSRLGVNRPTASWRSGCRVLASAEISAPKTVAEAGSSVWVENSGPSAGLPPDFVWRLDATIGSITSKVHIGYAPDAIAVGPNAVWVGSWADLGPTRIAMQANKAVATIRLGRHVGGAIFAEDAVWFTAQ